MILLTQTCWACPEQYDAHGPDGSQIGYLRLRHGAFTVESPDVGGTLLLEAEVHGDGEFADAERDAWLRVAVICLESHIGLPITGNYCLDSGTEEKP